MPQSIRSTAVALCAIALIFVARPMQGQERPKPRGERNPLVQLEALIGTWEMRSEGGEAPFPQMEWDWRLDGNLIHKTLSLPVGATTEALIEGFIAWDPWERQLVGMQYNKRSELLFRGFYERVAPDTFVHTYTVYSDWQGASDVLLSASSSSARLFASSAERRMPKAFFSFGVNADTSLAVRNPSLESFSSV